MNSVDRRALVEAWVLGQAAKEGSAEYQENWWAIEKLIHLPDEEPEETWEIILAILRHDRYAEVRDILAASPLEDLLTSHGPKFIERVEALAASDERFRSLLAGVWLSSKDTPIHGRVYAAAGIEPPFA